MHRFFVSPDAVAEGRVTVTGEDAVHALRVLRMRAGDQAMIYDGANHAYMGTVETAAKDSLTLSLGPMQTLQTEPATRITLCQGMPKAGKLELILQKGTELGITAFLPFYSARSVPKPGKGEKAERYQRVVYEAAKQSGRGVLPTVERPVDFPEFLREMDGHELALVAWEEEHGQALSRVLRENPSRDIALIIGPEGGFGPEEVAQMKEHGVLPVTLGPRILRTETAGLVMAAAVLFQRGDMD